MTNIDPYIHIPYELADELGYRLGDCPAIKKIPSQKTIAYLLRKTNMVIEMVSNSTYNKISRTIPLQKFKEEIMALETKETKEE